MYFCDNDYTVKPVNTYLVFAEFCNNFRIYAWLVHPEALINAHFYIALTVTGCLVAQNKGRHAATIKTQTFLPPID